MDDLNETLVSVVVLSYNSSLTIQETLDSIHDQTYGNIELIIADDKSIDNTKELCERWIGEHKERFVSMVWVEPENNSGVAGNANRGIKACQGEWIKLIAADDILFPDCIEKNVAFVYGRPEVRQVFSRVRFFGNEESVARFSKKRNPKGYFELSQKEQYLLMLIDNRVEAPSAFMKKDLWEAYSGFDERFPMIEDWPFWIKIMKNGERLFFLDVFTVKYRLHESLSVSISPSPRYLQTLSSVRDYVAQCQEEVSPQFFRYCRIVSKERVGIWDKIRLRFNPYYWKVKQAYTKMFRYGEYAQ